MKEFQDRKPVLVIGGTAQDFFGEYMSSRIGSQCWSLEVQPKTSSANIWQAES
jgi:hypothetical protein